MAAEIVKMDKSQLNTAMAATADVIRAAYATLYQLTGTAAYNIAANALYTWAASNGFADDFGDLINAIGAELSGGGASPADISNIFASAKAGSFELTNDKFAGTQVITHNLGSIPDFAVLWTDDVSVVASGESSYYIVAFGNVFSATNSGAPKRGAFGIRTAGANVPAAVGSTSTFGFITWPTTTTITITTPNTIGLKGSTNEQTVKYNWIVGKFASGGGN